ncbi:glutathione S-transferase family protein [Fluviibacterium sp. DFM31]|uniref:Glutathione S-transferase family protein n=1 Tax=Meridianimarinicoccus marinus TaxID=3231483 RepID=A0ABV3L2H6_9RHOB
MTLQLHCFGESGNAYKAALALQLSGLEWEPIFVDFFNGAARSAAYREEINPMGEAPVLVDGPFRLSQSGAIQQFVVERSGALGGREEDRFEVLRWQFWDNHRMSSQAGMTRFLCNYLSEERRAAMGDVIAFNQARLLSALQVLDHHLATRDWVVGDGVTIADLSCCGYLYYPEPYGFIRKDHPHIDAWLDRIAALPGWKHPYDLMPPARPENQKGPA